MTRITNVILPPLFFLFLHIVYLAIGNQLNLALSHAHGDVLRFAGGRVDAVDVLVGSWRRERAELGNVGADLDVVQRFGKYVGCGHPRTTGIPPRT